MIKNLLDRPVVVRPTPASDSHTYEPDADRLAEGAEWPDTQYKAATTIGQTPVVTPDPDGWELPPEEDGVFYIVEGYIAQIVRRADLLAPGRDLLTDLGNVYGPNVVRELISYAPIGGAAEAESEPEPAKRRTRTKSETNS